jgi:hypothetical protein
MRHERPHIMRLWPSTIENGQMIRSAPGWVGEDGAEEGKIDLRLFARRRLEAALERLLRSGSDGAQKVLHRGVAAGIAELPDSLHSVNVLSRMNSQQTWRRRDAAISLVSSRSGCALIRGSIRCHVRFIPHRTEGQYPHVGAGSGKPASPSSRATVKISRSGGSKPAPSGVGMGESRELRKCMARGQRDRHRLSLVEPSQFRCPEPAATASAADPMAPAIWRAGGIRRPDKPLRSRDLAWEIRDGWRRRAVSKRNADPPRGYRMSGSHH